MKNLVIVGAGGYFLELFEYITCDINNTRIEDVFIKGVLDDRSPEMPLPTSYLGTIDDYTIEKDDIFLIAIGNVQHRENIFNKLKAKSASFFTYIHPSALVSPSAVLGEGTIVCPMSVVNARAIVAENVSINVHASVGHEVKVGEHSVLSPYCALNGAASIGRKVFVGTRSTIFPIVSVGNDCIIDSHTAVRKSTGAQLLLSDRANFVSVKNRFMR